jgi:hypothetical protein
MFSRGYIYIFHRIHEGQQLPRHTRNSANILSRVSRELDKWPLPYQLIHDWPYHLLVHCNRRLSVYAGGMDNRIEIAPLKDNGEVDKRFKEVSFMTPKGVVNYILKKYSRKG